MNEKNRTGKNGTQRPLGERIENLVRDVRESVESSLGSLGDALGDALGGLVAPQPALIPIPVRGRRRDPRR